MRRDKIRNVMGVIALLDAEDWTNTCFASARHWKKSLAFISCEDLRRSTSWIVMKSLSWGVGRVGSSTNRANIKSKHCQLTDIRLRDFIIRTIAASISCFLSSSTLLRVSFRSGSDSPLAATVWIFTLKETETKIFFFKFYFTPQPQHNHKPVQFRNECIVHFKLIGWFNFDVFLFLCIARLHQDQQPLCSFSHRQRLHRSK